MPASAPSLDAALKLSPHFEHLNSKTLPKGYSAFKGDDKKYAVLELPIQKSENDQRQYRMIRLENGLEALICSDPSTDKAAAALNVRVGHLSDPVRWTASSLCIQLSGFPKRTGGATRSSTLLVCSSSHRMVND